MEYMEKELQHEGTRIYHETMCKIVEAIQPKKILEIGFGWGISSHAFLTKTEATVLSVDKKPFYPPALEEGYLQNERFKYIEQDSATFFGAHKEKYDFIYVDGSHIYEDVKGDLKSAWELLEDGGHLVIDDIHHKHNFDPEEHDKPTPHQFNYGVQRALMEFLTGKCVEIEVHHGSHGVAVIKKIPVA